MLWILVGFGTVKWLRLFSSVPVVISYALLSEDFCGLTRILEYMSNTYPANCDAFQFSFLQVFFFLLKTLYYAQLVCWSIFSPYTICKDLLVQKD